MRERRLGARGIRRREGDWFAIPLAAAQLAVGLVVLGALRRGKTLFGCFFGPIRTAFPESARIAEYGPGGAERACRSFDGRLVSGTSVLPPREAGDEYLLRNPAAFEYSPGEHGRLRRPPCVKVGMAKEAGQSARFSRP